MATTLMVCGLALFAVDASAAGDDAYLEMIEAETEKIGEPLPTAVDPESEAVVAPETEEDEAFRRFREFLKEKSLGSYTFFEKLTPAQRREIFERHKQGASLEEVRETIMQRFLNR